MKKLLSSLALCVGFFTVFAQETSDRQNDIMLSPIELIAGPALNISYERLLNENSGIGLNAVMLLESGKDNSGLKSQVSPYYRMYFGKKYASGFFVEGFVPITTTNDSTYLITAGPGYYYTNTNYEKNTTVGVGVGFGGKWHTKNNIIFEASVGIARRFGLGDEVDSGVITGKGMLGMGYRF